MDRPIIYTGIPLTYSLISLVFSRNIIGGSVN